jgi:hypothetical protein
MPLDFNRKLANDCVKETPFDVVRETGDGEARGFARALSMFCREQIGQPLYDMVAKIATVVLERDISVVSVREWGQRRQRHAGRRRWG